MLDATEPDPMKCSTRRHLLALLACRHRRPGGLGPAFGQGISIARREAAAARQALGPAVSCAVHRRRHAGGPDRSRSSTAASTRSSYILEVVGCGVAFIDYDNDGWLDIFVLNGTRLEGAPAGATNRLYKNNRDGTFTDVTEKAGLRARAGHRRSPSATTTTTASTTSSSPTGARTCSIATTATARSPTSPRRPACARTAVRYGSGCTWVDYDRDGHLDLFVATYLDTTSRSCRSPARTRTASWKGVPVTAARAACRPVRAAVSQQRRRHVHRRQPASPASPQRPARIR